MRNCSVPAGVYRNMLRLPLFLLCSLTALAQQPPAPDPLDTAIRAAFQTRNSGHSEQTNARRDEARALLQHAPIDSPRFPDWVRQVSQLYQNAGWNVQARAVLQESLGRSAQLGDSHPSHIAMLTALGESWAQDGNLLKAVSYLEQAAAIQPAAAPPPAAPPAAGAPRFANRVVMISGAFSGSFGPYFNNDSRLALYSRLADLYQQLGRPDAVAAVGMKIRTVAATDPWALARFYEQHGQLDEAAALYQKQAETSTDPQTAANLWQSLAQLNGRQEHYGDAVGAMQKAITAAQSSDKPGVRNQVFWMRQTLAGYLRDAGQLDRADELYQQLLQESRGTPQEQQVLSAYSQYLASTERGAQAESVLKDYLDGNSNLEPQQKINAFFNLANVVGKNGNMKAAEEYRKAAQALQPQQQMNPATAGQVHIADELGKAQTAANQHQMDDAYRLALDAIDSALQAVDGQQITWRVPQIARALAAKEPAKAEQLFQRTFAVAQTLMMDTRQPLVTLAQSYANFLMAQPDRLREVPAAIDRYRGILIDGNGPESATLAEPLRMTIEFQRQHSQWQNADASVRELLELQESLTGNSSNTYLDDLQIAVRVYQSANDYTRALPLLRKAITIADVLAGLNSNYNEWRRSQTRMDTALALAHMKQFDEAIALGEEAIALQRPQRNPRPPMNQQLEQIRQMRNADSRSAH